MLVVGIKFQCTRTWPTFAVEVIQEGGQVFRLYCVRFFTVKCAYKAMSLISFLYQYLLIDLLSILTCEFEMPRVKYQSAFVNS